ncbi:hypothetical protein IMZ48_25090 [Candidatus Bathyarchaeota archaeon]|nr:hypothetical protein [Candidatus Bathyarchaeota archaeon]
MRPQQVAGAQTSAGGPAYTPTTTTTGSDHHAEMNQRQGHNPALERLRRSRYGNSIWDSRSPPRPSSSSNSQIPRADTQGQGTMSTVGRQRRTINAENLPMVLRELLSEVDDTMPPFTSPSGSSRAPSPEPANATAGTTDSDVRMREGRNSLRRPRELGSHVAGGGGRAVQIPGVLGEWVAPVVGRLLARLMALCAKVARLYWHYLSCFNPGSELSARMEGGRLGPLDALGVIVTCWVTFYLMIGLYAVYVYLLEALGWLWEEEVYYGYQGKVCDD